MHKNDTKNSYERTISGNYHDGVDDHASPILHDSQQEITQKSDTTRRSSLRWFGNSKKDTTSNQPQPAPHHHQQQHRR